VILFVSGFSVKRRLVHFVNNRKTHLDLARGVAALAVCASHLRAFQFVTYSQVQSPSILDKLFYLVTGYGHEAVMVFFVLSGYFIAGSVSDSVGNGRWTWSGYALRRLTRLWLVLIPALVLTVFWDGLGGHFSGGRGYDGRFADVLHSGPTVMQPLAGGLLGFLGNVAFLQTIACPAFGTNSPLWSLANEFWYYVLFPLGYLALWRRTSWPARLVSALLCGLVAFALPPRILLGFGVWLLGYGVYVAMRSSTCMRLLGNGFTFSVFSMLFLGILLSARTGLGGAGDFLLGVGFAGMMPFLVSHQPGWTGYRRVATALSEFSYTLYVVHFPMLAFLFFSFRLPAKSQPGFVAYLCFVGLLTLTLVYAAGIWWMFEKRTDSVRKRVELALWPKS